MTDPNTTLSKPVYSVWLSLYAQSHVKEHFHYLCPCTLLTDMGLLTFFDYDHNYFETLMIVTSDLKTLIVLKLVYVLNHNHEYNKSKHFLI